MALRKEPDRRYASVEQFASDIRRHLRDLPVSARRDTFENVTTVLISFSGREQPATIFRFNSNIHALNGMTLGIVNDTFENGVRGCCACDEKHDPNESNPN